MSLNLTLNDDASGCSFDLYQTPTNDTKRILEGKTRERIFELYIEWLKGWHDEIVVREHQEKIHKYLAGHPSATWSYI